MNIRMTLSDTANRIRGAAQISLNWEKRIWSVEQDTHGLWRNLSMFRTGKFDLRGDGVMCLVDEAQQSPVRLSGSPRASFDLSGALGGSGSVSKPLDPSLANAKVDWKIEGSAGAATAPASSSGIREKLIARLRQLLPCSIDGTEKDPVTGQRSWVVVSLDCKRFAGTSCGSLPGFVSAYLGAEPLKNGKSSGIKAYDEYMKSRSLNGTNRVRDRGNKFGAWVEADGIKRPKPGDIYALLDRDSKGMPLLNKKTDSIGHVGVILDASGPIWKTADLGQGTGFDGKIDIMRPYNELGQLWGEAIHPGVSLYRTLAGWVDIDAYFPTK